MEKWTILYMMPFFSDGESSGTAFGRISGTVPVDYLANGLDDIDAQDTF